MEELEGYSPETCFELLFCCGDEEFSGGAGVFGTSSLRGVILILDGHGIIPL